MFTLENESPTHYTVKHPKGDVLKIAKAGLSKDMHANIKKLAWGGEAKESSENPKLEQSKVQNYDEGTVDAEVSPDSGTEAPQAAEVNSAPIDPPSREPQSGPISPLMPGMNLQNVPNLSGQLQQDIGSVTKGAEQEAQAKGALGNQNAAILHEQAIKQQAMESLINQNFTTEQGKLKQVTDDYNSGKIDFNRVWHDKSTPQKILAGIGMVVSGMGAGLTHQPNAAIQMINDEIDRDMKSQMANQEKKKTAFDMYKNYYGNTDHALQAQKLGYQQLVATKMNELISKNAGPMAEAQKNLYLGQTLPQMQKGIYDLAVQRAGMQFMQGGANGNSAPQSAGENHLTGGKPSQGQMIPVGGAPNGANQESSDNPESDLANPDFIGRTGSVDLQKLNGLQMLGWLPKEDKEAALKETKEFQEAQSTKTRLLTDLNSMSNSVKANRNYTMKVGPAHIGLDPMGLDAVRRGAGALPFEIGSAVKHLIPPPGDINRQYEDAESSAQLGVNTLLTKRIGKEALEKIALSLPARSDSDEEMKTKIGRVMSLIDSHTSTPTLDRYHLINSGKPQKTYAK